MSKKKQKSMEELLEEALVPEEEQPYQVPENWVWVRLGNYLENHNGARVPVSAKDREKMKGNIPYYGASGVIDYVNDWTHNGKFVLIAEDGANLISRSKPISFLAEGKIWVNNHAHILKGKCGTPEEYVCYYINSISLHNYVTGTAQPKLTQKNLNKIQIPVAPLDEQKRIAEKIERLFAKIDEAKRLIEEVKESFELRQSAILDKVFKGQLGTNDPNEKSILETSNDIKEKDLIPKEEQPYEIPENWVWVLFKKVVRNITNGKKQIPQKHYQESGMLPVVDQGQKLISGYTDNLELRFSGELPVIIFGDHTKCIKWVDFDFVQGADGTKILKPLELIYPKYLYYLLKVVNLPDKGYSRHFKYLKDTPLPIAPLSEQKRIAEKVDSLLSKLETEKEMVLEVEQKLGLLKQSILNKAFRGELGTNNPTDEHAIELLKEVLKSKKSFMYELIQ
ncbi:restriction endonuclease [Aeribacillus pallidus]|uniref:restriction endonuclease subunit S n=1 Tax=Aeribacillus pallidus TaxID=33936 RepID=UPI001023913F|nr:restriction endonuclease subunit S [Aeribacillus pallidus]RZI51327.1 restriction endonuclease [Aeribacillus pallidus]